MSAGLGLLVIVTVAAVVVVGAIAAVVLGLRSNGRLTGRDR